MHAVLGVIATILYKSADVIIPLHTLHISRVVHKELESILKVGRGGLF
jgi:hypothetical protein